MAPNTAVTPATQRRLTRVETFVFRQIKQLRDDIADEVWGSDNPVMDEAAILTGLAEGLALLMKEADRRPAPPPPAKGDTHPSLTAAERNR
jgi:hypothetical protein